uniref:Uncharacterized protein n=1 Tax=Arundo donax TaxID=35708 RepID=A0A0A8XR47_ARUDO
MLGGAMDSRRRLDPNSSGSNRPYPMGVGTMVPEGDCGCSTRIWRREWRRLQAKRPVAVRDEAGSRPLRRSRARRVGRGLGDTEALCTAQAAPRASCSTRSASLPPPASFRARCRESHAHPHS